MSTIKILHLSDFHRKAKRDKDQEIVLEAILKDVKNCSAEQNPDLIVFSGDLVNAGDVKEDLLLASSELLNPILSHFNLDESRLFICPGNHDVDRDFARKQGYIETGLQQTLIDRDSINSFVDQYSKVDISADVLPEAFGRLKNFYHALWAPLKSRGASVTPFSLVEKIQVGEIEIGMCVFNSAWRSSGEGNDADRGKLVIGERVVDQAVDSTKDCTIRIAVFHHPLDWLVPADRHAVESRLHADFDAFFFGHVHTVAPMFATSATGGAVYSQSGCLYQNRNFFNGYSTVTFDLEKGTSTVAAREYSDRLRTFSPATGAIPTGAITFEFSPLRIGNRDNLLSLLASVRPGVKRLGDEHVRLGTDDSIKLDLERHFVCPPLSKPKRVSDEKNAEDELADVDDTKLTLDDVMRSKANVILLGPTESGKTSFVHHMALKTVAADSHSPRLPLIGQFYDFQKGKNAIWRAVRAYANEISDGKITSKDVEEKSVLLFVDGVVSSDDLQLSYLLELVSTHPEIRWVFVFNGDTNLTNVSYDNEKAITEFIQVKIGELSRSSIRQLAARWLNAKEDDAVTNKTYNKVMEHIQQSGLPRNGYIVALILWNIKNSKSTDIINEAVLLENIIDYMLGKMDYKGALRSEFDFISKVAVLQELAIYYRDIDSSVAKNQIVSKVIEYLNLKGLNYDGARIVEGFIKCGIFIQTDDLVSFRYKRFQEFFTAGYLRDNRAAFDDVINADGWIGYARELDIYTSRYRNETYLLETGRKKVDARKLPQSTMDADGLNSYLSRGSNTEAVSRRLNKMKKEPMSALKIDELRDKADASVTRRRSQLSKRKRPEKANPSAVYTSLANVEVYTQFIRNLEFADNSDKKLHLSYCLDQWVTHIKLIFSGLFDVFSEIRDDIYTDPEIPDEQREMIVQMSRDVEDQVKFIVPRYVSETVYHKLGSDKLSDLIHEIACNDKEESFKRILSAFILLDIDAERALSLMNSATWVDNLPEQWVSGLIESKLHQYYHEQHLTDELRVKFQSLIATIEGKLSGSKKRGILVKGKIIQNLAKSTLISKLKNNQ